MAGPARGGQNEAMIRKMPAIAVGAGVTAIVVAMLVAPYLSLPIYSSMAHSTSELAGQNMPAAWIMRAGFLAYGGSVVLAGGLSLAACPPRRAALIGFGLAMIATAVWSTAPIDPGLPADMAEDRLHSIASGAVGAAFAMACALALFGPGGRGGDGLAWLGLLSSVVIPLAMGGLPDFRGLLQRGMFAISFAFVLREFIPWRPARWRR